jgi:hypothetical protein
MTLLAARQNKLEEEEKHISEITKQRIEKQKKFKEQKLKNEEDMMIKQYP